MSAHLLLIPNTIFKKEFGKKLPLEAMDVFRRTARRGLLIELSLKRSLHGAKVLKGYATSLNGARRVIYMERTNSGNFVLLLYRDKSDPVGKNMSKNNRAFNTVIEKCIDIATEDLEADRFQVISLDFAD